MKTKHLVGKSDISVVISNAKLDRKVATLATNFLF